MKSSQILDRLDDLVSVYPFNEYEFLISSLMGYGKISLSDYQNLRDEYISRNLFMYVFEISAPRGFGEAWAQGHLKEICPELVKPTKKLDENYSGQYDQALGRLKLRAQCDQTGSNWNQAPEELYRSNFSGQGAKRHSSTIRPSLVD
jgi:hypothetical protein